jgi:mRNA interferase RelE/StbE
LYKIEWTEDAIKDLQKLDKFLAQRILKKITWFSHHFDDVIPEPLSGDLIGTYKFRIGDWRVVYTIENDVIVVHAIGHRREIYR